MTTGSDAMPDSPLDAPAAAPAILSPTRPFYWSARRELWENRSIYVAPLAVAAVILFGFLISTTGLPRAMRAASKLDLAHQAAQHAEPYHFAAAAIILTSLLVAVFYSLGALHGERRDRSILFWKSLPVSDLVTVASKASIPLVVMPLLVFAIVVVVQLTMLLLSTMVLLANGPSPAPLWTQLLLVRGWLALLYSLAALALWHAPIYGWLLLVSGWARRATFLWAFLPPLALCLVEKIAFNTSYFGSLLVYRLGGFTEAFADGAFTDKARGGLVTDPLSELDPVQFLTSPGLWTGLVVAAAFLAAAVWLRRYREPI
jgi:ABC-2 type transport system permease protein